MYELDKKKFGSFVAGLRKEKGMTQKELARQLYISDKAVSKWETGVSIPDTALLMPLADQLGVTVTELMTCQKIQPQETMEPQKVECVVKTAITYAQQKPRRAYQEAGSWPVIYALALVLAGLGLLVNTQMGPLVEELTVPMLLGAVFGMCFIFFAHLQLPGYYDQNRIGGVVDGPLRLHLPGVAFNNRNWPYILRVGRVWACTVLAVWPWVYATGQWFAPKQWEQAGEPVLLVVLLGGLFIPMYVAAKRHE